MKREDPREQALYDVLWRVRELLSGCMNLDGSILASRKQVGPLREAVREFDRIDDALAGEGRK